MSSTKEVVYERASQEGKEEGELSEDSLPQEQNQQLKEASSKGNAQVANSVNSSNNQQNEERESQSKGDKLLKKRIYKEDHRTNNYEEGEQPSDEDEGEIKDDFPKQQHVSKSKESRSDSYDSAEEIIKQSLKANKKENTKYKPSSQTFSPDHSEQSSQKSSAQKYGQFKQQHFQKNNPKQQPFIKNVKKQQFQIQQQQNRDKFYTTKQGKRFKVNPNQPQQAFTPFPQQPLIPQSNYLKSELCKFFLTNNCHRGMDCNFSHNTKDFPCKYLHGTGTCEKGMTCKFSHNILNPQEIQKFMRENEEFLSQLLTESGKTNLGDFFIRYLKEKEDNAKRQQMQNLMLPPQLMGLDNNQNNLFGGMPQNNQMRPVPQVSNNMNAYQIQGQGQQQLPPTQNAMPNMIQQISGLMQNPDIMKLLGNIQQPQPQSNLFTQPPQTQQNNSIQSVLNQLTSLIQPQTQQQQPVVPQQQDTSFDSTLQNMKLQLYEQLLPQLIKMNGTQNNMQQPVPQANPIQAITNQVQNLVQSLLSGQQNQQQPQQQPIMQQQPVVPMFQQFPQQLFPQTQIKPAFPQIQQPIIPQIQQPQTQNILGSNNQFQQQLQALLQQVQPTPQATPQINTFLPQQFQQPQVVQQTPIIPQTVQQKPEQQQSYDPRKQNPEPKSQIAKDLENIYKKLEENGQLKTLKPSAVKGSLESSDSEDDRNAKKKMDSDSESDEDFFDKGKKKESCEDKGEQAVGKQSLKDKLAKSGIIRKSAV